jgi:hypothetical protein
MDPDPAMLVPDLQDANIKYFLSYIILLLYRLCKNILCILQLLSVLRINAIFGTDPDPQIHFSLWLMDLDPYPGLDPDPALFVIDLQDAKKN